MYIFLVSPIWGRYPKHVVNEKISFKDILFVGIIMSIIMRTTPDEVRMVLVDPKKVEFNVYDGMPHLYTPVVTDPKKASRALHTVVEEMERRYELFSKAGVRNIATYNQKVEENNACGGV